MKKVSAFSVFKGKKDKGDSPALDRNSSKSGSLKKASSEPVINGEDDSRSKKLLRAIKGGSFRNTVRGNKHRPTILADGSGNSPFVAGDGAAVKLTAIKGSKTKAEESVNTSINGTPSLPKKLKKSDQSVNTSVNGTPALPKRAKKSVTPKSADTTKTSKQKKNLPPLPVPDFNETPRSRTQLTNGEAASDGKIKGKRGLDDTSPSSSVSKKKRVESPKQAPAQQVNPQRKDKLNKKKLIPNAVFETVYDSTEEARKLFECMIHPVETEKFFNELWQKKPLLVRRHIRNYNDGWFSTQELDKILEKEHIEFGVNLDVTSYQDGKRETHNPPGRAYRSVVWDFYQNGCSVRMLNPQTYSRNVWKMLATLQEYFGCCVGANVYLTPPGTQGFAPHFDDIEAFILQLEGKKHWRLYNPRSEQETLPRESSGNFDQSEIGSPILDVTLEAGDLLYFPRGTIHQGYALEDAHSLHITFSCYQKNTWGDLFQKLLPRALEIAVEEDMEFREGLPTDYLNYTGVVNSDIESAQRDAFTQKVSSLLTKMIHNYCPIDAACDQLGKQFIHDSLPPVFSEMEKSCSVHGHGEKWDPVSQGVKGNTEVEPDTMIKLVRKGCLRLVTEEDTVRVYHNIENARVYRGREPQFIEITPDLAPAVEFLIHSYPEYVSVDSLPAPSVEERVEISSILYDKGLLLTGEPLQSVHQDVDLSSDENCGDNS